MAERDPIRRSLAPYADDFVVLCRTAEDAHRALEAVRAWVAEQGLTLHPTKTKIIDARTEGFAFLGYAFHGCRRLPRDKSLKKLKDAIRQHTKRTSGNSLMTVICDLNRTLRRWFAYFQHYRPPWVFCDLDRWIRMRLRSILRKRSGRKGRGRGLDHHRWPNKFFTAHGLMSLREAHAAVVQSSRR